MCGIVGYIGKRPAVGIIIDGLKDLEYRGYDSAGIALLDNKNQAGFVIKQAGRVEGLEKLILDSQVPASSVGVGHTRWATHGLPTTINAHPQFNTAKTIFVVHNGIIENYLELKSFLITKKYKFISQTDTEVVPQLIDYYYRKTKSLDRAFEETIKSIKGAYAIVMASTYQPDKLYVAKLSSPLVIGVGKNEYIIASDPTPIMQYTKEVVYLEDFEIAVIDRHGYRIKHIEKDINVERKAELLDLDVSKASMGDFPTYMLKEIFEAPQTIMSATLGRVRLETNTVKLGGLESVEGQLKFIDRIVIVACGTSSYAGLLGEYLIEEIAGIPVEVQLSSEFKYRHEPFSRSTALIAISQSGETADTIAALKKVDDYGVLKLGIVNVVGSTIARMTDAGVYTHAGPEYAVASTKAFIAQVVVLIQIALMLAGPNKLYRPLLKELIELPNKVQLVLDQAPKIEQIAKKYVNYRDFIFIGRNYDYPAALEGALKLKEISYIHAEGYAAGEMKHGPIAMIDKDFPTFALACDSPLIDKTYSNIEEIKARGGPVVAIANKGNTTIKKLANDIIYVPKSLEQTQAILEVIAMQLFAYYIASQKGLNVDKPRNLAKSVTVE
ncbi:MAG TPA: glutamine--fructose-6-phosphate transaminase (isomerizing) [Candidatus Saccharimonadales bacterium]|jgi:glucosamine--fructose-6-phosphate aminotransferase (isomerizing)|nr:glutamine--fructose-6-phosphate transaminase (isomerizing) [Candidatus Saccharimonadales bacterium]